MGHSIGWRRCRFQFLLITIQVGSMDIYRSRKGVYTTTGQFSADARNYVDRIEGKKVVLIDGEQLCRLMIDHKIGVTVRQTYEIVDVSQDFFDADEWT
jgi:restriction system protein